jgi:alpha-N-acetylglucosamine transferase
MEFDRVLGIDSDSAVLQNLYELFLLSASPLTLPYEYWGEHKERQFSSQMMLIRPSEEEFVKIEAVSEARSDEYDMDIIDKLYREKSATDSATAIQFNHWGIQAAELRCISRQSACEMGPRCCIAGGKIYACLRLADS